MSQQLAKQLAGGCSSHEQQLNAYVRACVDPAYAYFLAKFDNDLKPAMQVFKAAHYFSPVTASELKPTTSDLDILQSLSFLTSGDITNLKTELPCSCRGDIVNSRPNKVVGKA